MSNAPPGRRGKVCPHCDAPLTSLDVKCWLCEESAVGVAPRSGVPFSRTSRKIDRSPAEPLPFQFGLSTLLLVMTLASILFSIFTVAPGLAWVLALFVAVGFIGLIVRSEKARGEGYVLTRGEKVSAFMRSVWILALVFGGIIVVVVVGVVIALLAHLLSSYAVGAEDIMSIPHDPEPNEAPDDPSEGAPSPPDDTPPAPRERRPFQYGLSSLFLITTLACVMMSLIVMMPGLGIAIAVLTTPALMRTYIISRRFREFGKPASNNEKVLYFINSLAVAVLGTVAVGAAFFVTCFVGFLGGSTGGGWRGLDTGLTMGGILGTVVSIPVLILLLRAWIRQTSRIIDKRANRSPRNPLTQPLTETPPEQDP